MDAKRHYTSLVAIVLVLFSLAGCGRKYTLDRELVAMSEAYPCWRGDLARTGAVEPGTFDGKLNRLWTRGIGGKPIGPLAIHHDELIVPDAKRRLRFVNLQTGKLDGSYKAKGVPQTGVAVSDTIAFYGVAPKKKFVRGVNLYRSKRLWQTEIKDVLAGPIIVDNRLIVSSSVGRVVALDLTTGETVWTFGADRLLTASAACQDDRLYQPGDRGRLYVLSTGDGAELYRVDLDGPLVSPVALADRVYAADMIGHVYALDPSDGHRIWTVDLERPIWTSPAVADGRLFIGHSAGELVALAADDGHELWRYDAGKVIKASPLVIGDKVVVGTMSGKVAVLRTEDGQLVDSAQVKGAIKYAPVTDGKRLFVATQAGKIICFGERDEQAAYADHRIESEHQSE